MRLGKRPEKPKIFKTKLDKHVESRVKLAEKRAKELRKLRELDLPAWSSCQSRNTCETGSGLADSTAHAHKLLPWLLSTDVDDEDEDDGESHSNLAPWLRNRQHMWRAAREARSAEGSTRAAAHGISDQEASEPASFVSGTVYVNRTQGASVEKVEVNKALAILQNELEYPAAGRRARYILRNYRGAPKDHDLCRSNFYARRYGGAVGACFFSVAQLLELQFSPPGKTSSHPRSCLSSDSESVSASWLWVSSGSTTPPTIGNRDSYLIQLGESDKPTRGQRFELMKLGFVEYGSGSFTMHHISEQHELTLRGPLPPTVISTSVKGISTGSLVLQLNGRSVMDFDSTTKVAASLNGATIGVWVGDHALTHDEQLDDPKMETEPADHSGRLQLPEGWAAQRTMPSSLETIVHGPFAYKWDHPVGWDTTGIVVDFHTTGEYRNSLEVHWADKTETCLSLSDELRPSAYGEDGRWVVLIPPSTFDADAQLAARQVITPRLQLLPKAWSTIGPEKLMLMTPMQNLAAIMGDDQYEAFPCPGR